MSLNYKNLQKFIEENDSGLKRGKIQLVFNLRDEARFHYLCALYTTIDRRRAFYEAFRKYISQAMDDLEETFPKIPIHIDDIVTIQRASPVIERALEKLSALPDSDFKNREIKMLKSLISGNGKLYAKSLVDRGFRLKLIMDDT